ncbi:hypothetical protein V8D89_005047 [Ganoderma adspersum]
MDSNTTRPISHLPAEVLFLIFWCLHGQYIARCMRVCRCFADLIRSSVYLQYKIELGCNGMIDGLSSTLPVSERLQRLRQYSSKFRNGIFDHEDLNAHPDYIHQLRDLQWSLATYSAGVSSILYSDSLREYKSFLSVFTDGSAQAGIQSRRWIMPIGTPGDQMRFVCGWLIDHVHDLLVTIEQVKRGTDSKFFEVRFCSWSGSQTTRMDHPAATLPCIQVFPSTEPAEWLHISSTIMGGRHIVWQLFASRGQVRNHSIHVCNWRTGKMILHIDLGANEMSIALLDDTYILVLPRHSDADSDSEPYLKVYSLAPSVPDLPLCTLQLPALNLKSGERVLDRAMSTSRQPPIPEGHFYADPSVSMVVLTHNIEGQTSQNHTTHLLIPCTALLGQIRAVVDSDSDSHDPPVLVRWKDWGSRASLRLWVPPHPRSGDITRQTALVPYGSRMPIVAFDDAGCTRMSVYVFDINPLAARHERLTLAAQSKSGGATTATAVVADVEAALPGVVDAECAAIPFVVYRFGLPPSPAPERPAVRGIIRAVRMSMTGFTVTFGDLAPHGDDHTWTV